MMFERRKTERDRRSETRVLATFAVKKSVAGRIQLCQAEDIAPGGMTIKRPRGITYSERTTVRLNFALPGSREEIAAEGIVVHDARCGSYRRTGVRFIGLRPEHERLIAGFCRRT